MAFYYLVPLENNQNENDYKKIKKGAGDDGYRTKAVFTKRPQDPYDPLIEKLYAIRPIEELNQRI